MAMCARSWIFYVIANLTVLRISTIVTIIVSHTTNPHLYSTDGGTDSRRHLGTTVESPLYMESPRHTISSYVYLCVCGADGS